MSLSFTLYHNLHIRPKGGYEEKFSLAPIAPRLSELLNVTVPLVADCVGRVVAEAVAKVRMIIIMRDGESKGIIDI